MVEQNLEDYVRENKFQPVVNDLVKDNEKVLAKREKERSRQLIAEKEQMMLMAAPPPWEKEGLTHREWLHKELAKHRSGKETI